MNPASGASWSSMTFALGLDVAAKATAILVIVLSIQFALGRRRALLGSAVGNSGLIGLLLLPVSVVIFPSLPIACLPARVSESRIEAAELPRELAAFGPVRTAPEDAFMFTPNLYTASVTTESARELVGTADDNARVSPPVVTPAASGTVGLSSTPKIDWHALAILLYALGALVLIARLGTSMLAVARLRRSCVKVKDAEWINALERWRLRLGLGRAVPLASSPAVSVPVVLGWLDATVVLPASLLEKSSCCHADAILLHELSHIRRGDYVWNLCLRLVQALYWPHVLVWLLGRAIAATRERACDDLCVHEMGGPSVYRQALIAVASAKICLPGPALGLAMSTSSKLGRRLAQIEQSDGHERCVPRRPVGLTIASLVIVTAGLIGAIQLVRAEARAASPQTLKAADSPRAAEKAGRVFHLQVVSADTGAPVPDADVHFSIGFRDEWLKTDAQGRLDIIRSIGPSDQPFRIDVWGKGRAMQRHYYGLPRRPILAEATIRLHAGETLGGLLQDDRGRPIAGATILLSSNNFKRNSSEMLHDLRAVSGRDGEWQTSGAPKTTGELSGFQVIHPDFLSSRDYMQREIIPRIADLRAKKAVTVMTKGVPIEGRVVDSGGKPVAGARVFATDDRNNMIVSVDHFTVSTDADGRFRTWQVKAGEWFLVAIAKGHGPGDQHVSIGTAVPQVEITLGQPRAFKGKVVDPDGKPIADALVRPDRWRAYGWRDASLWTDADGRFRWDDAPDDPLIVDVNRKGYRPIFQQKVGPSSDDVVFTLQPILRILGQVRTSESTKGIENATVEYGAVDAATGEQSSWVQTPEPGIRNVGYGDTLDINFTVRADAYKFRVRSPGFQPFVSRTFKREELPVVGYDITLVSGTGKIAGPVATVLRPNGRPLAGARLFEIQYGGSLSIEDRFFSSAFQSHRNTREDRTSPDGTFPVPQYDKPWIVFILGDDFYAFADQADLGKSRTIQAKPYARVEGQYLIGRRPVPNQELHLQGMFRHPAAECTIFIDQKTTTDPKGRFTFERVVPETVPYFSRQAFAEGPSSDSGRLGESLRVEPGATAHVTLRGKGRAVIGRIEPPTDWTEPVDFTVQSLASLQSNQILPVPFSLVRGKTSLGTEWRNWSRGWSISPEGREYERDRVIVNVGVASDGSFRIDDVVPGDYRLSIRVNGEAQLHVTSTHGRDPGPFGRIVHTFTVPTIPGGRSDDPLDLGVMRLRPRFALKVGEPAPSFEVDTVDGKRLAVPRDFKGKFLLIDFGTTWDSQAGIEITRLNDVNERFGKGPRFAMLSLTFAADSSATRKFISEKGEPWPQAIVGPLSNPISLAYAVDDENVPVTILIGPDGSIVAKDLWYDTIGKAVGEALGRADK